MEENRLISVVARSGTWATKYFLAALDRLAAGRSLDVGAVFDVAKGHPNAFPALGIPKVAISHIPTPGFASSREAETSGWADLARDVGFLDTFQRMDRDHSEFVGVKTICIYRHPFDLLVAYGRRRADMIAKLGKDGVMPLHESVPVRYPDYEEGEDSVTRFIDYYRESKFFEVYLVHFLPHYLASRKSGTTMLLQYEEMIRDRLGFLTKMLHFLGVEADTRLIWEAADFTSIERMKDHEKTLGHSLSGERYFYGPKKENHITKHPPVDWQTAVKPEVRFYAKEIFGRWGLDPQHL